MITRALFVRLEAKTGREEEVENFRRSALNIVDTEDGTPVWFALRFGPSTFGIFDAFPDEDARQAHLSGQVAASLMEKAPELLARDPTIERVDLLAAKVDIPALQAQPHCGPRHQATVHSLSCCSALGDRPCGPSTAVS